MFQRKGIEQMKLYLALENHFKSLIQGLKLNTAAVSIPMTIHLHYAKD